MISIYLLFDKTVAATERPCWGYDLVQEDVWSDQVSKDYAGDWTIPGMSNSKR
jgi:hypothetical protein